MSHQLHLSFQLFTENLAHTQQEELRLAYPLSWLNVSNFCAQRTNISRVSLRLNSEFIWSVCGKDSVLAMSEYILCTILLDVRAKQLKDP